MMRVIRRKDDPTVIKRFAVLVNGSLGDFDEALYEEVELVGGLPNNYTLEPEPKTGSILLSELRALFQASPIEKQYALRQGMAEVVAAAQGNNIALMKYIIENFQLPAEDETLRTQMLAVFS